MAHPTPRLISALRATARHLRSPEVTYKWSSFAHCNCGHLVRTLTGAEPASLQRRAIQLDGDWGQKARHFAQMPKRHSQPPQPDFGDRPSLDEGAWEPENVGSCQITGTPLDFVFSELEEVGLEAADFEHLERLSHPQVRRRLGNHSEPFPHHVRENVIRYLDAWADVLDAQISHEAAIGTAPRPLPKTVSRHRKETIPAEAMR